MDVYTEQSKSNQETVSSHRILLSENLYTVLSLTNSASVDDVNNSYTFLVDEVNHDSSLTDADTHKILKVLEKAYETLNDGQSRTSYDLLLQITSADDNQSSDQYHEQEPDPSVQFRRFVPTKNTKIILTDAGELNSGCSTKQKPTSMVSPLLRTFKRRKEYILDPIYKKLTSLASHLLRTLKRGKDYIFDPIIEKVTSLASHLLRILKRGKEYILGQIYKKVTSLASRLLRTLKRGTEYMLCPIYKKVTSLASHLLCTLKRGTEYMLVPIYKTSLASYLIRTLKRGKEHIYKKVTSLASHLRRTLKRGKKYYLEKIRKRPVEGDLYYSERYHIAIEAFTTWLLLLIIGAIFVLIWKVVFPQASNEDRCDDYYGILGVTRGSNRTQIKKSYRKLATKLHPDKLALAKEINDTTQFRLLVDAYKALSNSTRRKEYDLECKNGIRIQQPTIDNRENATKEGVRKYGLYSVCWLSQSCVHMYYYWERYPPPRISKNKTQAP